VLSSQLTGGSVNVSITPMLLDEKDRVSVIDLTSDENYSPSLSPRGSFVDVRITDTNNKSSTISENFKGKYLLVDISQTGCEYCIQLATVDMIHVETKQLISSEKCSALTLIPATYSMSKWLEQVKNNNKEHTFSVSHADAQKIAGHPSLVYPTLKVIDVTGNLVGNTVTDWKKLCSKL
jgi:thioredoxin-related protein